MKKILWFIGATLYSEIISFVIAVGFAYLTTWFLQFGWTAAIIYFLIGTIAYGILNTITMFAWAPLYYCVSKCNIAKWIAILPLLYYGYIAITLPWKMPFDYSFVNYFMAFEISSLVLAVYSTMVISTVKIKTEEKKLKKNDVDKFEELFNRMLLIGGDWVNDNNIKHKITEIIVSDEMSKKWEQYCLSRRSEVLNKFNYPSIIYLNVTGNEKVKGNIINYGFSSPWFFYEVEFEKGVGFDNSFPRRDHSFTEQEIIDIVTGKKRGSFTHMIIRDR